jgi:hypothetical protein
MPRIPAALQIDLAARSSSNPMASNIYAGYLALVDFIGSR